MEKFAEHDMQVMCVRGLFMLMQIEQLSDH